jgi:hypothetical protein
MLNRAFIVSFPMALALGIATAAAQTNDDARSVLQALAGKWTARELKVPASTELDQTVWGPGASKVRNVELALEPDGDGVLIVRKSVVDARGKTKQFSSTVVEARLHVEAPTDPKAEPVLPKVTVLSAEERYLDGSGEKVTIEGLKVSLHTLSLSSGQLNVRFDPPQGTGSFGETLQRESKSVRRPG